MYCTQCGVELSEEFRYCPQCAAPTGKAPDAREPSRHRPLVRRMRDKVIGGVCAGFADFLNVEVTLVRIVWLTVAVFTGVGFIAYLICWIVMPRDYDVAVATPPEHEQAVAESPASGQSSPQPSPTEEASPADSGQSAAAPAASDEDSKPRSSEE